MKRKHRLYFPKELRVDNYLLKLEKTKFYLAEYLILSTKNNQEVGDILVEAKVIYLGNNREFPVVSSVKLFKNVIKPKQELPMSKFLKEIQEYMEEDC